VYQGDNSPESVIAAPVGSLYLRRNGSTATTAYIKESGTSTTGWRAVLTGTVDDFLTPTGGGKETVATNASATGGITINLANGNYHALTTTGNVTSVGLSGATNGKACSFTIEVTNGGTHTITWGSAWKWPGGVAPTLSGRTLITAVTRDGGTTILAGMAAAGVA